MFHLSPLVRLDSATCGAAATNVSAASVSDATQLLQFRTCSVAVVAAVPLCTARQVYNRARVYTAEVSDLAEDCDFARDFLAAGNALESATIGVSRCSADSSGVCALAESSLSSGAGHGVLSHNLYDLDRNKSYCVFYQLDNPHCRSSSSASPSSLLPPCFFRSQLISCSLLDSSPLTLLTQPVFVAAVSLTLFLSLALLCWTVVQCSRKRPETPIMQPPIKKPPR